MTTSNMEDVCYKYPNSVCNIITEDSVTLFVHGELFRLCNNKYNIVRLCYRRITVEPVSCDLGHERPLV